MHGRVKVRTTEEQEKIKQLERQKKLSEFKRGMQLVVQKRKNQEWNDELLLVTEKILVRNPDIYTLWNVRREIFFYNNWTNEEHLQKFEQELTLTELCLRENPKSYCIWHHRTWVNEQISDPNWRKELELCNKCLNLDERNCKLLYIRFIVNKAKISDLEELEFTTTKILNNFSNYSSWYYRSKLLQKLYPSNVHDLPIKSEKHDEELDLVMNATFTDPNDSSAWFYHRWLLDFTKPQYTLWQAVLTKNKIIAVSHKQVSSNLYLYLNNEKINCKWKSATGRNYSFVWTARFKKTLADNSNQAFLKLDETIYNMKKSNSEDTWIYKSQMIGTNYNISKLKEQLENYRQLSIMEPKNKWSKLTSYYLMLRIDPIEYHADIIKILENLMELDPLRINYYKDIRSKCILDYSLHFAIDENIDINYSIDLSTSEITTLSSHVQYLTFYRDVNLANNYLGSKLYQLYTLQECETLDLSNNTITSLRAFPTLNCLKILLLTGNQITNSEEVIGVIERHNLSKLDLRSNPIPELASLVNKIKDNYPDIKVVV
ncbi:geranylgeranyl transferase type-2 subunit alpha isoform X2 [Phymastichus coffea]|uniref:geranylgeranyl transferase type-2 subunit alpha isoform X2 n=1 Tax=Phymastichus coffea TaxID=108790 RepID=UPI00273B00D4|nr:geranylgeranyl transferase type-2 subunit alpha isoform X2 [Phymastichus coffea]